MMAAFVGRKLRAEKRGSHSVTESQDLAIAVVGMAGRFPDAPDLDRFWRNLRAGVESIHQFDEATLDQLGIPDEVRNHPRFVAAGTILDEAEMFDASFFGFTPRQAEHIDPQHRIFLETAWQALEDSGNDPWSTTDPIGVFAGANPADYARLMAQPDPADAAGSFEALIGTFGDTLATRVAHRLNLTGPAMTVQTACSTSLVAVHLAVESLLSFQCSLAIAGGVSLNLRQLGGYFYQEGMILSPDGHCRAFDAKANGTVLGQGCGAVVLKRLSDAVEDGDTIRAVIRGSAVNNDGADKIGFTAPSETGQAGVIAAAQAVAGVDAGSIGYVEAHGTGTALGDPIEIAALTRAFRMTTRAAGFCHVGSVKANIGHLDAAAGIAGLIKTILVLEIGEIPPTIHFVEPNPNIDFEGSPFVVNSEVVSWQPGDAPRRAGVSSFGIGGTNAHIVLEEAPSQPRPDPSPSWQLLPVSARTEAALAELSGALAEHLAEDSAPALVDAAHTLQLGRRSTEYRRIVVATTATGAATTLASPAATGAASSGPVETEPEVVFMFSGQGAQYGSMAGGVYDAHPIFRSEVDECAAVLEPLMGTDIRQVILGGEGVGDLDDTEFTQPALYVIEHALARLLTSWGIEPVAVVGHSIGEYVAATMAGILDRDDALRLVAERGRMMQALPAGAMLAVMAGEAEVHPFLSGEIALAAVNSTSLCAVSGSQAAIDAVRDRLTAAGIDTQPLVTSHAFHSPMMEPIVDDFRRVVSTVPLSEPTRPILSNLTGTWMTPAEATDPDYWARHLRNPVRFADNLAELLGTPDRVLLEVGPGRTLATLARQHAGWTGSHATTTLLRHPQEQKDDMASLLEGVGRLWLAGFEPDWSAVSAGGRRVPLPTYPFQRSRHWAAPVYSSLAVAHRQTGEDVGDLPRMQQEPDDWFYLPSWTRTAPPVTTAVPTEPTSWLIFSDSGEFAEAVVSRLRRRGDRVSTVEMGADFTAGESRFTLNPREESQYDALMEELASRRALGERVLHLWTATPDAVTGGLDSLDSSQERGLHSVLNLARALGRKAAMKPVRIDVVSTGLHDVTGRERIRPENATLLGATKVIPLEYSNMTCTSIDVDESSLGSPDALDGLVAELDSPVTADVVALRGRHRWLPGVERMLMPPAGRPPAILKPHGTYLVLGGLGGVGLSIARALAEHMPCNLVLVSRSRLVDRSEWAGRLAAASAEDEIGWQIRQLMAMEAAGSEVLLANADIAAPSALGEVVGEALSRYGRIDGVVHAAGVVDDAGAIHNRSRAELESVVSSKVRGTLAVAELVANLDPDFFVLCSSVATRLYHNRFGQVGYVAANSFLEAFAESQTTSPTFTTTISWDDWQDVGMTARTAREFAETYGDSAVFVDPIDSFTPAQGVEIFERVLASGQPRVLISTRDLEKRIELDVDATSAFLASAIGGESGNAPAELSADYPGARTRTESTVAHIWSSLLGVDAIGMEDDYFQLGGDSLRAAQVVDRMRDAFGLDLPINILFEAPTIAGLAGLIDSMGGGSAPKPTVTEGKIPDMVEGSL